MTQLRPSSEVLHRLKSPMGTLLRGEPSETMPRLRRLIEETNPPKVIAVGDVVSRETKAAGIKVNLRIIDRKTLRSPVSSQDFPDRLAHRVGNPAGVITSEAWDAIKQGMLESEAVIVVEGEEDLLALPSVVEAPSESFVIYGQPSEGVVVVVATPRVKEEVALLLRQMPREKS